MTICLELNDNLMRQALQISGLTTETETVESALRLLIEHYTQLSTEDNLPTDDFRNNPVIGMWKNREEMTDSVAWVRQLRGSQWTRNKSARLTGNET